MPVAWTERLARLDAAARSQGYSGYSQRRNETAWFSRHGLSLSDRSVQNGLRSFAVHYARELGVGVGELNRSALMGAFRQEAVARNLTHSWDDAPIMSYLEDRGIVDLDDGGWDDWWDSDSPGTED